MAKKKNLSNFIDLITNQKRIDKEEIKNVLETIFEKLYLKKIDPDADVKSTVDMKTGDVQLLVKKKIVEKVNDDYIEVSIEDSFVKSKKYKLGSEEYIPFDFDSLPESAFNSVKQMFRQNLKEKEDNSTFEKYSPLLDTVVKGKIYKVNPSSVLVTIGDNDTVAYMNKQEMILGENYEIDSLMDFYVVSVERISKDSQIKISRAHPNLLKELLRREIPEIADGIVEIKGIARIAGQRAKVAVTTKSKEVDPVGSVIGPRGINANKISKLLNNEKIDVVRYKDNTFDYLIEALSPARIVGMKILEPREVINSYTGEKELHRYSVAIVNSSDLVQAIGKRGINVKLAVKLTGYNIDIKTEEQAAEEKIHFEKNENYSRRSYNNKQNNFDDIEQIEMLDADELEAIASESGFIDEINLENDNVIKNAEDGDIDFNEDEIY